MTKREENQSQNQQNEKIFEDRLSENFKRPIKIVEALSNFYLSVQTVELAFKDLFEALGTNIDELHKLQNKLSPGGSLWRLEELGGSKLPLVFLASITLDKPQYLQFEGQVVEIRKPEGQV